MFFNSRKKKQDAFEQRAKQQNVWQKVRRIIDKSTPNLMPGESSGRVSERYGRCIPMFCTPVINDDVDVANSIFAITTDFSDNGVSIISTARLACESKAICGFFFEEPFLLLGSLQRCVPFGGQFYKTGIEFTEVVEDALMVSTLATQLQQLNPVDEEVIHCVS